MYTFFQVSDYEHMLQQSLVYQQVRAAERPGEKAENSQLESQQQQKDQPRTVQYSNLALPRAPSGYDLQNRG